MPYNEEKINKLKKTGSHCVEQSLQNLAIVYLLNVMQYQTNGEQLSSLSSQGTIQFPSVPSALFYIK